MLEVPGTMPKGFSNELERIGFPIANSSKANDQACVLTGCERCVVPNLLELSSKDFRTHVVQLTTSHIIDVVRAAHEPVTQPLVLHVGSHAVIRRRGDDPVERPLLSNCQEPSHPPTIAKQSHAFDRGKVFAQVALCPGPNDL